MVAKTQEARKKSEDGVWETIKVVLQALAIAFVIRMFFFQPFNIPSGSMIPTLRVGDYLFVNKLSYGYGPYSFNLTFSIFGTQLFKFGPMPFSGRVFEGMPERGDVVVFKLPTDNETDYIKRVIGLPGDRIQVREGVLYINGEAVKRERIEDFAEPDEIGYGRHIRQYRETLPDGVTYITHDLSEDSVGDNTQEYVVPANHFFMMGDNRDNSTDSRFPSVGPVPYENLIGKANIIFFSHRPGVSLFEIWRWPIEIRWNRLLNWVR
ncbi:MAG: signal peptidase I [Parvibaculaceae bacterium]